MDIIIGLKQVKSPQVGLLVKCHVRSTLYPLRPFMHHSYCLGPTLSYFRTQIQLLGTLKGFMHTPTTVQFLVQDTPINKFWFRSDDKCGKCSLR